MSVAVGDSGFVVLVRLLHSPWLLIHACSSLMGHFLLPVLPPGLRIASVTLLLDYRGGPLSMNFNGWRWRSAFRTLGLKVRDPLIMFPLDCNSRSSNEIYGNVPSRSAWSVGVKRTEDVDSGVGGSQNLTRGFSITETLNVIVSVS